MPRRDTIFTHARTHARTHGITLPKLNTKGQIS